MAEVSRPFGRVHKPKGRVSDQQKRRELALERQKLARRDLQTHARHLALSSISSLPAVEVPEETIERSSNYDNNESGLSTDVCTSGITISELDSSGKWTKIDKDGYIMQDDGLEDYLENENDWPNPMESGNSLNLQGQKAREWYSKQLSTPEWMVDVPHDLSSEWYAMARPEGLRCLVVSCNGTTVSRLTNGRIFHKFPSALPNGARARNIAAPSHVYCILDCIFNEANQTYYILDVMCWKGYSLYNCSSEFRLFWLQSKLQETGASDPPSSLHRFSFHSVPVHECNLEGLRAAYEDPAPFQKDGLLLYNRHAHYTLGVTPLVLRWKDANCSQYVMDTDSQGVVPANQMLVLELAQDGKLVTSDSPALQLGCMPQDFVQNNAAHWKEGTLLRFSVGASGIQTAANGSFLLQDLKFEGLAKRRGGVADTLSKILFQHALRMDPITISDLVAAVKGGQSAIAVDDRV